MSACVSIVYYAEAQLGAVFSIRLVFLTGEINHEQREV